MSEELFSPTSTPVSSLPDPEGIGAMPMSSLPASLSEIVPTAPKTSPTLSSAQALLKQVAEVTSSPTNIPKPYTPLQPSAGRSIVLPEEVLKSPTLSVKVEDELEEAQRIRNTDALQDVYLKKITLAVLFAFLALETMAIFGFAFLQGSRLLGFQLEEWSFNLLMTATILQITYMIQVAVRYLFSGLSS